MEVLVNLTLIASTGTNKLVTNILEVKAELNVATLLWKFVIFLESVFFYILKFPFLREKYAKALPRQY